jgi:CO dehydrogenase maturation factor
MTFHIALAGKGGTGKTTVAGLLIKYLAARGKSPILAVDADCNANLNEVLGLDVADTLGQAREDMKVGKVPQGMTKDVFMSMRMEEAVVEQKDYDLLVMGQPEGPGCYCAANSLLTRLLERLVGNYSYVVMDNEAGMEHISRLTTNNVDLLLIVTDTSRRGLQAGLRINKLAGELKIGVARSGLIVNQARGELIPEVLDLVARDGLELVGTIPEDDTIYEYDLKGKPTITIDDSNPAVQAAYAIFDKVVK